MNYLLSQPRRVRRSLTILLGIDNHTIIELINYWDKFGYEKILQTKWQHEFIVT